MHTLKSNKRLLLAMIISFVLGTFWLAAVRFATYKDTSIHYHANFALYVDGQREEFDNFTFYEEVQSCNGDQLNNPKTRTHMHDNVNHVVHVHDAASTWGHFFANLGYTVGNEVIKTEAGVFVDGQDGKRLRFILNGQETESIANQTIRSEDALLIDYGASSQTQLDERFADITRDAADYNKRDDPSACTGGKPISFGDQLKHAVGIGQ